MILEHTSMPETLTVSIGEIIGRHVVGIARIIGDLNNL